jgi:hypothetical protein
MSVAQCATQSRDVNANIALIDKCRWPNQASKLFLLYELSRSFGQYLKDFEGAASEMHRTIALEQ